jgi:hypothetical protein
LAGAATGGGAAALVIRCCGSFGVARLAAALAADFAGALTGVFDFVAFLAGVRVVTWVFSAAGVRTFRAPGGLS